MSKWYKSALVKGILIFLSVLSAITALLSLVIISTYSVSVKEIWNKKPTEYTDSKEFENQMCRATMDVLGQISYEDIFETDGKYNPDKLIDAVIVGFITGIIGARLYYVIFYDFSYYMSHPLSILNLKEGGTSHLWRNYRRAFGRPPGYQTS